MASPRVDHPLPNPARVRRRVARPEGRGIAAAATLYNLDMLKRLAVAVALLVTGSTLLPAQPSPPTIHSSIAFDGIRVAHPAVASTGIFVRRTIDGVT